LEFYESDKLKLNYKLAIKNYKLALKINKNNHELLNKLVACYYHCEDECRALYCYEEAAKNTEDNYRYLEVIKERKEMGVASITVRF